MPISYACPMHPELQSDKPGHCPKCGMNLEVKDGNAQEAPEVSRDKPALATAQAPIYACPMHPEVKKNGPGTCPKCGMSLEPKSALGGEADASASPWSFGAAGLFLCAEQGRC